MVKKVTVRTKDGELREVGLHLVWGCKWLKRQFYQRNEDDHSDSENTDSEEFGTPPPPCSSDESENDGAVSFSTWKLVEPTEPVYMPFIESKIMDNVIQYCDHYWDRGNKNTWNEKDTRKWDKKFLNRDFEELRSFLYAVYHLGLEELSKKIALAIKRDGYVLPPNADSWKYNHILTEDMVLAKVLMTMK